MEAERVDIATLSGEAAEEWFLTAVESGPNLPFASCLDLLRRMAGSGQPGQADTWAELLYGVLAKEKRMSDVLALIELQQAWHAGDDAFHDAAAGRIGETWKDTSGKALRESAGWDGNLPVDEAIRRSRVLLLLKPQALCFEKTWGFGVVRSVDMFYKKAIIDFRGKTGHQMSLAYAAESLDMLGDDHLMARLHREPGKVAEMIKTAPGDIARLALESFGPLTVEQLKDRLAGAVVPGKDWAAFWEGARKKLKDDPLVEVPFRRSEPMRMRERRKAYDAAWFADLKAERDMDTVLSMVDTVLREEPGTLKVPENVAAVRDRLAFAIKGCSLRQGTLAARGLVLWDAAGLTAGTVDQCTESAPEWATAVRRFTNRLEIVPLFTGMPLSLVSRLVPLLAAADGERLEHALLSAFLRLPPAVLDAAGKYLIGTGHDAGWVQHFDDAIRSREALPAHWLWLCENMEWTESKNLCRRFDLIGTSIQALDMPVESEDAKAQTLLRRFLEDGDWLVNAISTLAPKERQEIVKKIDAANAWDVGSRRSLMARIIKRYPDTADALVERESAAQRDGKTRFTSWRSFRERSAQLQELIEVKIPANSRDIAHARGYGDLRENFEYKAAKDEQRLLLRRQAELERDLGIVKGTDFAAFPSDKAGLGTCVTIRRPDGRVEQHIILGEWDRDESIGIISSETRLAQALAGHKAGEEVTLPSSTGDETCKLETVGPLPDSARSWMANTESKAPKA